jgi:hypothetical protein
MRTPNGTVSHLNGGRFSRLWPTRFRQRPPRGSTVASVRRLWSHRSGLSGSLEHHDAASALTSASNSLSLSPRPGQMNRAAISALVLVSSHALSTAPPRLQSGHQLRLEPLYPSSNPRHQPYNSRATLPFPPPRGLTSIHPRDGSPWPGSPVHPL